MTPTTAGLRHHDEARRQACSITITTAGMRTATALDGGHAASGRRQAEPLQRSTAGMENRYDARRQACSITTAASNTGAR
jgi:hypothetical protein